MTIPQSSFQWKRPFWSPDFTRPGHCWGRVLRLHRHSALRHEKLGDFSWEKWEDHGKISGENQERMGFLMVPFVLREHQPLENPIKSVVCHQSSRIYSHGKINHRFSNKTLDFRGALFSDPRSNLKWLDFCKLIVFENMPLFKGAVFDFEDPRPGWSVGSCCSLEPTQSPDWTISWAVFKTTSRPFTSINIHYNHYTLVICI